MRIRLHMVLAILLLLGFSACGGDGGGTGSTTPTSPTTPTTPTAPTNQAPVITAMTVTPTFGIQQLSLFSFSASATDANNDALTYTWDFGDGTQGTGTSVTKTYNIGGNLAVRLSVSDGKTIQGVATATTSDSRSIVVGSMSGEWTGTVDVTGCAGRVKSMSASLTQLNSTVTGTVALPEGLCSFSGGTAKTDPAEPGRIDVTGAFQVRVKIPPYTDVYFRGTMDSTGKRVSGGIYNSGHNGTPFVWTKQ